MAVEPGSVSGVLAISGLVAVWGYLLAIALL